MEQSDIIFNLIVSVISLFLQVYFMYFYVLSSYFSKNRDFINNLSNDDDDDIWNILKTTL